MLSSFQPGQRRPANGLSALLHTGHHVPAPSPSRISTHCGPPAIAGHTGRPGPQPLTASMATMISRRNAATHQVVRRVVARARQQVQLPTLPFSAYRPGATGRDPWVPTKQDAFGQQWYATQVEELWVYSHQVDSWGSQEFVVYNPRTKIYARFTPVGYISGKAQIQGTASATGEFGRVYFNFLAGTAATFATLGVAAEFEAGSALLTSTRGVLIRCGSAAAGQATRLAGQIAEEFTWKGFLSKVLIDGSVQFGSGLATKGSIRESAEEMNYLSMFVSGILPGEGFLPALRNSTITSTVKVGVRSNSRGVHPYLELPELTTMNGVGKYLLDIGTGTFGEVLKGRLSEGISPVFRWSTRVLGRSGSASLRWFSVHRELLGTMLGTIGAGAAFDALKDHQKERLQDQVDKITGKAKEAEPKKAAKEPGN